MAVASLRGGLWIVLATAGISGVSTLVNLYAVSGANSDAFVTVRNAAVAAMMLPLALLAVRRGRVALRGVDWARLVAIGVVGGGVPFLLFFRGLELASSGGAGTTASFYYRTLFAMATLLGFVFLGERLHRRTLLAAGLLLAGSFLLLSVSGPAWTDGSGLVLIATALWATEYTVSKSALRELPSGVVALGRMGMGALFLFGYLAVTSQLGAAAAFTGAQWEWVGVSALLLGAFVATWYAGLRRTELGTAASVLVLGYPVTWALSLLVRGTAVELLPAVGALAVTLGALVAIGGRDLRVMGASLRAAVGPVAFRRG